MKTARDEGAGGYHPLHWLEHAYLQLGRVDDATKMLAIIEDDAKRISSAYNRTHLAMCRATMLVETRGANGPASVMEPVDASGINSVGAFSNHDLAIALEHIRRKDLAEARRVHTRVKQRIETAKTARASANGSVDRYSTVERSAIDAVGVLENILDAAIEFAAGDRDNAIKRIIAAGEAEDKLDFEFGPPAIVKPAWELAGEMLLEAGRKKEAADAFRNALKRYPNRRLSTEGLRLASM
jgi:tetratricopeptide (TPR) repeat protein